MNQIVKIRGWDIAEKASSHLVERGSTKKTVKMHNKNWQRLYDYAQKEDLTVNFHSIGSVKKMIRKYLLSEPLTEADLQSVLHSFKIFKEFILNGKLRERRQTFDFSVPIGVKMIEFISKKENQHVSQSTIRI